MVTKKITKKQKKVIATLLIIIGSFVAGIVSEKNPQIGGVIKEVVTVLSTSISDNQTDTIQ